MTYLPNKRRQAGWFTISPAPEFLVIKSLWSKNPMFWRRFSQPNSWKVHHYFSVQSLSCTLQWKLLHINTATQVFLHSGPKHHSMQPGFQTKILVNITLIVSSGFTLLFFQLCLIESWGLVFLTAVYQDIFLRDVLICISVFNIK